MKAGYHIFDIPKGVLGRESKIVEEFYEYLDAKTQNSKIMMAVELADLHGAITSYLSSDRANYDVAKVYWDFMLEEASELNLDLDDLIIFSDITARAFKNGYRT
jgi:hypothetical protein